MVAAGLLISLLISLSPVEIVVPETVEQGDVFRVTVSCNDTQCRSLQCTPQLSAGLDFAGSSTSSSYSSVHTPSGYQTRQEFNDLLIEYANRSNGMILYEFIDPSESQELATEAELHEMPRRRARRVARSMPRLSSTPATTDLAGKRTALTAGLRGLPQMPHRTPRERVRTGLVG